MNKTWIFTIVLIIVALIVIGVMYENGMLNFQWQWLTVVFAALAGPYTFVKGLLFKDSRLEDMKNRHKQMQADEVVHRQKVDDEIKMRKDRIDTLNKEIEIAEKRIEIIEQKKKRIEYEVKNSSIDSLQNDAVKYFGD